MAHTGGSGSGAHRDIQVIWTPRQRKYLNILKRRRMNSSRPVKFPPGTLVKMKDGLTPRYVLVVDHNSGVDSCWVEHRSFDIPKIAHEDNLRTLTFGEFLWYSDPMTGHRKIGKNRALPLLLWAAIMLACSIASLTLLGFWKWFWPIVTVLTFGGILMATWMNYKGKQA